MKVTDLRFSKGQGTDHFKRGKQTGLPVSASHSDILDDQRRLRRPEQSRVIAMMYHIELMRSLWRCLLGGAGCLATRTK
eukprot:1284112-Amphidinium_carterae.1